MKRILTLAVAGAVLASLLNVAAAAAALPNNDLPEDAIAIDVPLPVAFSQDTTEATVTTDDVGCGAGGFDRATVWYTFIPTETIELFISTEPSSYGVAVNIFDTTPDADHLTACFAGAEIVKLEANRLYYLMFADADGDELNGGELSVMLGVPPPPLEISLAVDPVGSISKSGIATIRGTLTCSEPADRAELWGWLRQSVGRFTIVGGGFAGASCGSEPTPWSLVLEGQDGRFAGGRATVEINAFACGASSCGEVFTIASVRLGR
jgi:hypothetical protein